MVMQQTIVPGATVYGADGDKVGTIASATGSYIVVEKGFFFPKDYYIPTGAIAETRDDAVYLTVTKDEALNQGWDQPLTDTVAQDRLDTTETAQNDPGRMDQMSGQEAVRIPVHEEHLTATTSPVDAGDVTISKQVVTQQETIEVPVSEERVRVAWKAPSGEVTEDGDVFEEGAIEIPVRRDVVDVSKRTVQTGELEVTKEQTQRTQKVTDSVRREVVDVDDATAEAMPQDR